MTAIAWVAGALVRSVLIVVVAALGILQVRACSTPPRDDSVRLNEVRAQLSFLGDALREDRAAERMQRIFPEGACFLATLYGLTWANVARETADPAARIRAVAEIDYALSLIDAPESTARFRDTQVRRGVFWAGQRNLVVAERLDLSPPDGRPAPLVDEFHARSRELAGAFAGSPTHHLDSYPGECWPADQLAALASLVAHDRLFGTDLARAADAWKAWTLAHLDPAVGLPAGRIDSRSGRALEPARGCGTSWILSLLPRVDAALAREFYARYAGRFGTTRLGFRAFAEWSAGAGDDPDVDSGPIVWGVGTVATGVGLAAARAAGDAATSADVYSLAQVLGFPWTSRGGARKSYLFGRLPMGDAFLAYGQSVALPAGVEEDSRSSVELLRERWKFHAIVTGIQVALAAVLVHGVLRGRRRRASRTGRAPSIPPGGPA